MTPRQWLRNRLASRRNGRRVRAYLDYIATEPTNVRVIDLREQPEARPTLHRA